MTVRHSFWENVLGRTLKLPCTRGRQRSINGKRHGYRQRRRRVPVIIYETRESRGVMMRVGGFDGEVSLGSSHTESWPWGPQRHHRSIADTQHLPPLLGVERLCDFRRDALVREPNNLGESRIVHLVGRPWWPHAVRIAVFDDHLRLVAPRHKALANGILQRLLRSVARRIRMVRHQGLAVLIANFAHAALEVARRSIAWR